VRNLEIEQQLIFCEKYGINPSELLLLEIILLAQEDDDPELVQSYFSSRMCARGSTIDLLQGLQDAGVILKTYKIPEKGQKFDIFAVPINKNLVKDFHKSSFEMGEELFENYPLSTVVNGLEYKLRRVSKKFNSLEDAYRAYGKAIRWKPEAHVRVLELIKQGKENGYQFTNLGDFIVDQDWLNMEAIAKDGVMMNSNTTML
jgi:hypothetical protein